QSNAAATGERALTTVDDNARRTAPYHAATALIAQAKHEDEKAEAKWTDGLQLAPDSKSYQLQLGILRLRSPDARQRASGGQILGALRSDPAQRSAATRALLGAA